jgi:hypothetical protein
MLFKSTKMIAKVIDVVLKGVHPARQAGWWPAQLPASRKSVQAVSQVLLLGFILFNDLEKLLNKTEY